MEHTYCNLFFPTAAIVWIFKYIITSYTRANVLNHGKWILCWRVSEQIKTFFITSDVSLIMNEYLQLDDEGAFTVHRVIYYLFQNIHIHRQRTRPTDTIISTRNMCDE